MRMIISWSVFYEPNYTECLMFALYPFTIKLEQLNNEFIWKWSNYWIIPGILCFRRKYNLFIILISALSFEIEIFLKSEYQFFLDCMKFVTHVRSSECTYYSDCNQLDPFPQSLTLFIFNCMVAILIEKQIRNIIYQFISIKQCFFWI